MNENPKKQINPHRTKNLDFLPDAVPANSPVHSTMKPVEPQMTRICRCCGQIARNLQNMRGNIRLRGGPKLWDWFIKFNDFKSATVRQCYAHICTICLEKLVQAFKFQQQCMMAEKVFQVEATRPVVARQKLALLQTVICKICKKRIPAVFQNRHCQKTQRRVEEKSLERVESQEQLAQAEGPPRDYAGGVKVRTVPCEVCKKMIPARFQYLHCKVPAQAQSAEAREAHLPLVVQKRHCQNSQRREEEKHLERVESQEQLSQEKVPPPNYARAVKVREVPCEVCKKMIPARFQYLHCKVPTKAQSEACQNSQSHVEEKSLERVKSQEQLAQAVVPPPNYAGAVKVRAVPCAVCKKLIPARLQHLHCKVQGQSIEARVTPAKAAKNQNPYNHFCELCGIVVRRKNIRNHHRAFHFHSTQYARKYRTKVVPCKVCKKPFMVENMQNHMRRIHNPPEKKHLCPLCGAMFQEPRDLKLHITKHSNPTPFECDKCDKKYSTPHAFKSHVKVAHEHLRYKCEVCNKSFVQFTLMKHHVLLEHKGAKLRCHVCSIDTFNSVKTLARHLRKVHQAKYDQTTNFVLPNNEKLLRHRPKNAVLIQSYVVEESEG